MQDTTPEIERLMRSRYQAMSGEERFLIGIRMFDLARAIVVSSLPSDLPDDQLRRSCAGGSTASSQSVRSRRAEPARCCTGIGIRKCCEAART